jgi:hypothetical protein
MDTPRTIRLFVAGATPGQGEPLSASQRGVALVFVLDAVRRQTAVEPRFHKLSGYLKAHVVDAASIADCDVVVPAFNHDVPEATKLCRDAHAAGKPVVFFDGSDYSTPCNVEHATVYRTSLDRSRRRPGEFAMPALCSDLWSETDADWPARSWREQPSVGFIGFVGTGVQRMMYRLTGQFDKVRGLSVRDKLMRAIESQSRGRIESRLIARTQFQGVADHSPEARRVARQEFIDNLRDSDYALSVRGKGNYSFRFYEAMSAGRLQLWLDTDSVLPFEDEIDWSRLLVRVDESDLGQIVDRWLDWHGSCRDEFADRQARVREVWQSWFEPASFIRRVLERAMAR